MEPVGFLRKLGRTVKNAWATPEAVSSQRQDVLKKGLVLLAAFVCQTISVGFVFSLGVFYAEFVDCFPVGRALSSWATSLCSGQLFGAGLVVGVYIDRFGPRVCTIVGGLVAAAGVLASAFVNSLPLLILTFGFINGLGLCLVQLSTTVAVGLHFTSQGRAAATSIASAGAGVGSLTLPIALRFFIDYYHWRAALMLLSAIMLNMVPLGVLLDPQSLASGSQSNLADSEHEKQAGIPPRGDKSGDSSRAICSVSLCCAEDEHGDASKWRNMPYVVYLMIAPVISAGYSFPTVIFVDLGVLSGVDKNSGTWLVIYKALCSIVSSVFTIVLLKIFPRGAINIFLVSLAAMAAVLFAFPYLVTYPALVGGAMAYGVAMGGLRGTFACMVLDMIGLDQYATGFGFVCTGYGVGYLLGTPIAGWMNDVTGSYNASFQLAGSLCVGPWIVFAITLVLDHRSRKTKPS